jgi:hypothetical protein
MMIRLAALFIYLYPTSASVMVARLFGVRTALVKRQCIQGNVVNVFIKEIVPVDATLQ